MDWFGAETCAQRGLRVQHAACTGMAAVRMRDMVVG